MTDKEFKRLNRSQLIEIIYQFQLKVEELTQENKTLHAALEDKRLRITQAGSIAEAALEMNNVMQAAQNAAQQYLDEIQALYSEIDEECLNIRMKANAEADAIIQQAKRQAQAIITQAQMGADTFIDQEWADVNGILESPDGMLDVDAELEKIMFEYSGIYSGSDE